MGKPGKKEIKEADLATTRSGVDSNQYIFSFPVESISDIPADFGRLPDPEPLLTGVFFPRDRADWLGRCDYPARVLLLTEREVVVAAHPSAREPIVRTPFGLIQTIESGRILLLGWIVLTWSGGQKRLPYNTVNEHLVDKYLKTLDEQWLPSARRLEAGHCESFGEPLNLKFDYAQSNEMLCGEAPLARFFQPAACHWRRWGLFRRESWSAGDLLVATSRRLLWIEERYQGRYEPYGTVGHSAPWASIAGVHCAGTNRPSELEVTFRLGDSWHVPLQDKEECEARKFQAAVARILLDVA